MLERYQIEKTAQFEIYYVNGERNYAQIVLEALHQGLTQLTKYFSLQDPFPVVRVVLVDDRDEFDRLVRDLLKVDIEVPSHPARIAQAQRMDMVLISPSAYAVFTTFTFIKDAFQRLVVHELVHMFEEFLSPNIEASPRWWGEGLAVLLSWQWCYDDDFRRAALEGIACGKIPTLDQIETEANLAYDWGWTVVKFLDATYGSALINRIVRECADGDVLSWVNEDDHTLESAWLRWLSEGVLSKMS